MIKIRVHGVLEEVEATVERMREQFVILSESEPHKDRGRSEYYRVYLDCELKQKGVKDDGIRAF